MVKIGLPSSCCCFSLSTGVKIIAILELVFFVIQHAQFVAGGNPSLKVGDVLIFLTNLVASIILLVGVFKQNAPFYLPWLVATPFTEIVGIITGIIEMNGQLTATAIFIFVVFEAFVCILFYLVVFAHYKEIKSGFGRPMISHA